MKLQQSTTMFFGGLFAAATVALGACTSSTTPGGIFNPQPSPSPSIAASPSPSPAVPTPPPGPTSTPMTLALGQLIGTQVFPNGDSPSGGNGQTIDSVLPCSAMNQTFHIHEHLSLWHNGQQVAMPTAVGIPGGTNFIVTMNGGPFTNQGTCFYNLHTHDSSGIIHIEDSAAPSPPFTLGELFDIWGEPLQIGNVAGFMGPTLVYVDSNEHPAQATVYTGDPRQIPLNQNHGQITIEVGGPYVYPLFYTWGY